MSEKTRRRDDEFPMLMKKNDVEEFLGVSSKTLDMLLSKGGLNETVADFNFLKSVVYIKPKVKEWVLNQ